MKTLHPPVYGLGRWAASLPTLRGAVPAQGFTLIEIMIVIGIAAMIMAIGIPSFARILQKDPLRQAVDDILEACSKAREQAIVQGVTTELSFNPRERSFHTGAATNPSSLPSQNAESSAAPMTSTPPRSAHVAAASGQWSEQLNLEMLDVNFKELKDEGIARVRFFPNGTSDEFTTVLFWPQGNRYRKITLDIITGLADVEVIK